MKNPICRYDLCVKGKPEPRIQASLIAESLGYASRHYINSIVRHNMSALERFGFVLRVPTLCGDRRQTDYYLNEPQALLICMASQSRHAVKTGLDIFLAFDAMELTP